MTQREPDVEPDVPTVIDLRDAVVGDLRRRLAASEARFESLVERSTDGVLVLDRLGRVRFANAAACAMLRRPRDDVLGQDVGFAVLAGEVTEVELVGPGRDVVYCEMRVVDIDWEDEPCRLALLRDMTARHAYEAELAARAMHDPLTQLPNRYLLLDRLSQSLARIHRGAGRLALFLVDLDDFKPVNDTYGHAAGDAVLVTVARLLRELVRPADTAARFGGDEFVLVCESLDEEAADAVIARVEMAFHEPMAIGDRSITIGASVGYVLIDDAAISPEDALGLADAAMYREKRRRRRASTRSSRRRT